MYEKLKFRLRGAAPLLMHNIRLANPLDDVVKELKKVTKKRTKTDDDHAEIMRLEWLGGLYLDDQQRPIVPGEHIEAALIEAAKKSKRGKDAKSSIFCYGDSVIEFKGPTNIDGLWADGSFQDTRAVRVQSARTMRTRPIFRNWEIETEVSFLPQQINAEEIRDWMAIAGQLVGLMDYRPRFGRFEVIV